jgi:SAM-dependent methyltransferase
MEHFYQNIGEDWFSYPQLYKRIVDNSQDGSHIVEVGSWKGRSAAFMAVEIINSNKKIKFDCVDTWEGSIEHETYDVITEEKLYDVFLSNIEPVKHIINPIRMTSIETSKLYKDNSLDFVFIDASHEYEDVKEDILAWLPKVKIGGILAGHDYDNFNFEGVNRAVNEIFNINDLEISEYCYIYKKQNIEKFYNIEEQKLWNEPHMWEDGGHEWSGPFGNTENLWNKEIFDTIKEFRGKKILEIAPGFGRLTQFLSILAGELIVIDLNPLCIQKTKEKLGNHVLAYLVNDGKSLTGVRDNSQDLVFSYDSFVHMHANVSEEYVKEIYRVLKPGGHAFIHHSWIYQGSDNSFENLAGRANMTPELFKSFVENNNMEIISQTPIKFNELNGWDGTDCISFFKKL